MAPTDSTSGGAEALRATVGLLGATGFVGRAVLATLCQRRRDEAGGADRPVIAFSRSAAAVAAGNATGGVRWMKLHATPDARPAKGQDASAPPTPGVEEIPLWIAVCPLWAVSEQIPLLAAAGARRLIALSSTSRLTKRDSTAASERAVAARLAAAEDDLRARAGSRGIVATLLRPTMIYDGVHDQNVARIARFIRRAAFYPLAGTAHGLRQPIHAADVAGACVAALARDGLRDAYEISGGETLPYRTLVGRIFAWLERPPRIVTIPTALVRVAAPLVGGLPGLGSLTAMAVRMNEDLVFDHRAAADDFGFQPGEFSLPPHRDSDHAPGFPLRTP